MAADLSAAVYAERGLRLLQDGDIAGAVGAFASISRESWDDLSDRFPGFPAQFDSANIAAIALASPTLPIENRVAALDDEPDWSTLGSSLRS